MAFFSIDGGESYFHVDNNEITMPLRFEEFGRIMANATEYERIGGSMQFRIKKLHIGALRDLLGDEYAEFRRKYLSRRKHERGRFRK